MSEGPTDPGFAPEEIGFDHRIERLARRIGEHALDGLRHSELSTIPRTRLSPRG